MSENRGPIIQSRTEPTLPYAWYRDEAIFALEREHIFLKEWILVAREEEIAGPGDSLIVDAYGESIILLRNLEGELRAFHNVCLHRGTRLCPAAKEGASEDRIPLMGGVVDKRAIVCPYHAWSYDLNGQLTHAPHMSAAKDFKIEDIQLHGVAVERWAGFVFINLANESRPDFAALITSLENSYQRYPLAELRTGHRIQYTVKANWKSLCENFNECYHCGPVHPELCKVVPAFKQNGGAGLDWEDGIPHREGATTFTTSGLSSRRTFPELNETEKSHHLGDLLYPNMFISVSSDYIVACMLQAKSADTTIIDCYFLFEPYETDKPNFDPSDAFEFWDVINQQDWAICERVQQGMGAAVHSTGYLGGSEKGMLSPMEDWSLDIKKYVLKRIGQHVNQLN